MGGRGRKSGITARKPNPQPTPQGGGGTGNGIGNPTPAGPTPYGQSVTLDQLSQMSDSQMAQVLADAKVVDMPNYINDFEDVTQRLVYQIGLNGKPTVMDASSFNQFMKQNGIPNSQILSRSVNGNGSVDADLVVDTFKDAQFNYIGGKIGGQVHGGGTYFDMNGGGNTGYGSGASITAVLNPATARVITEAQLSKLAATFAQTHPQTARLIGPFDSGQPAGMSFYSGGRAAGTLGVPGNNISVYAMLFGYNVVQSGSYHTVIDRSALVVRD